MDWVEHVFRSAWPEPAEAVKPCFPYHADVVGTLRGLKMRSDQVFSPPVKDGEIGAAPIYRQMDWDLDLERAVPRWKDSFSKCPLPPPDGGCSRSKPPSYSELLGPQNALENDSAAVGAWGEVPPDLPPPLEPWEVAAQIAAAQTTATKEEGAAATDQTGSPGISAGAESW
jgi:hypothetical protein